MTREQAIDEAVRHTMTPVDRAFVECLLSNYFFGASKMSPALLRRTRAEFRRIMSEAA